jgi:xanthine dehydrogenase/oxidase
VLSPLYFSVSGETWLRPVTLQQLLAVMAQYYPTLDFQLVAGNTTIGVTKYYNGSVPYNAPDRSSTYIDVSCIPEMIYSSYDATSETLSVGASVSISALIELLNANSGLVSSSDIYGNIFATTAKHLTRVANTQVRNAGTWAGNLMLFLKYRRSCVRECGLPICNYAQKWYDSAVFVSKNYLWRRRS